MTRLNFLLGPRGDKFQATLSGTYTYMTTKLKSKLESLPKYLQDLYNNSVTSKEGSGSASADGPEAHADLVVESGPSHSVAPEEAPSKKRRYTNLASKLGGAKK